jgi:hypothetical protein
MDIIPVKFEFHDQYGRKGDGATFFEFNKESDGTQGIGNIFKCGKVRSPEK